MKQLKKDLFIYALFLILSVIFYFIVIPNEIVLRSSWGGEVSFTSRTFPYLIFIIVGASSLIGLITTFLKIKQKHKDGIEKETKETFLTVINNIKMPVVFMLLIILYGFLFDKTGYLIATLIVPSLFLAVMKCRKWQYYVILYGFAIIVYLIFRFVLRIPL